MKLRVLALWLQFRAEVMDPSAPPEQLREMKRAFYAGVESALNGLAAEMSHGDALDNPSDEQVMREVQQELLTFADEVTAGRS